MKPNAYVSILTTLNPRILQCRMRKVTKAFPLLPTIIFIYSKIDILSATCMASKTSWIPSCTIAFNEIHNLYYIHNLVVCLILIHYVKFPPTWKINGHVHFLVWRVKACTFLSKITFPLTISIVQLILDRPDSIPSTVI